MKKKVEKPTDDLVSLNIDYFKYKTQLTRKFENRKVYTENDPRLVLAFIPGTVRKIIVNEGDVVKKGDLLLTLEAMKMENRIVSPIDGIVKTINAKAGVVVPKNTVLVEVEYESGE